MLSYSQYHLLYQLVERALMLQVSLEESLMPIDVERISRVQEALGVALIRYKDTQVELLPAGKTLIHNLTAIVSAFASGDTKSEWQWPTPLHDPSANGLSP